MKTVVWIAQQKRNSLHSYHRRNHKLLFQWQAFSAIYIINTTEYKFTIKLIIVWNFMPFFHFQYTANGHKRPDLDRDSTFCADNCHSSVDMEIQVFHHLTALWTKSMQSWNAARKVEIEKCKPISKSFTSFSGPLVLQTFSLNDVIRPGWQGLWKHMCLPTREQ